MRSRSITDTNIVGSTTDDDRAATTTTTADAGIRGVDTASVDEREHPFVRRIRLRARRYVLWMRGRWDPGAAASAVEVVDRDIDDIVSERAAPRTQPDGALRQDPQARALATAIADADRATADDDRLESFRRVFALDHAEVDLLTLCAALESAPEMRRLFGYLHDDAHADLPTPWLARQIFNWPTGTRPGPNSQLVRWHLARPVEGQLSPWSDSAGWMIDPYVAHCLTDGIVLDPHLGRTTQVVYPNTGDLGECVYPTELTDTIELVETLGPAVENLRLAFVGPSGAGKRTLAKQLCSAVDIPLVIVDVRRLLAGLDTTAERHDAIIRLLRTARLVQAAVYWHDAENVSTETWAAIRDQSTTSIFGSLEAAEAHADERTMLRRIALPTLSGSQREALWRRLSDRPVPTQVTDWPLLPGEIAAIAAIAHAGDQVITDLCATTLPPDLVGLTSVLPRPYEWSDVVLPESTLRHLGEFETQARLRGAVYEDWGFGRSLPMGQGIAALFAGPSGTGKTMAAQVVARSLGMEIYRVDLAGVMSKYIGDTEKHLRRIFDACERTNVVLFFDEADALFGQRMQVKDAHDRFANIEIDYLLQRMEQFDGIAILATNRRSEIDAAFLRRVRFIIEFRLPRAPERLALWKAALPEQSPSGEQLLAEIDWDQLAEKLELSGAGIKAAGLAAAFLARNEGTTITMDHVLHAAKRELAKLGKQLRTTGEPSG